MGVAVQRLPVMRRTLHHDPARQLDPTVKHSLGYTLVASALLALATAAVVLAVSCPVTAMGVVAFAGAGWYAVRPFRRFYRTRRSAGWTREVCVPKTGVCTEL